MGLVGDREVGGVGKFAAVSLSIGGSLQCPLFQVRGGLPS